MTMINRKHIRFEYRKRRRLKELKRTKYTRLRQNKLTKLLNKTEEINQNLYSLDGYPIFDLMQASNEQGYITSTGYSFYCEIEDVNSKLASINNFLNVEKAKEFIKEQSQYILENHK